jgi:hypothetical protein
MRAPVQLCSQVTQQLLCLPLPYFLLTQASRLLPPLLLLAQSPQLAHLLLLAQLTATQ